MSSSSGSAALCPRCRKPHGVPLNATPDSTGRVVFACDACRHLWLAEPQPSASK